MESVRETASKLLAFGDYLVIGVMILVSTVAGLYYGITKKKQSSLFEYFLAGRQMTLIPVSLSAFATAIGPGIIIGTPTESYNFGMQIVWWCLMELLIAAVLSSIFIPLYHKMGSMNVYKFLEVRYNRTAKNVVTVMFSFRTVLQCSNMLFATSIVFNQVTKIDTWVIVLTLTGFCVLYTSLGGMKGVMWADVIQAFVIFVSLLAVVVIGLIHVGGVEKMWQRNYDSGRLDIFDFEIDPSARNTFWTSTIGYFFTILASSSTVQIVHQRYLTAPTIEDAKRGNILQAAMTVSTLFLIQFMGIIIYATYHSCDPMRSNSIRNMNQIVPAFVMEVMGAYPILPGVFFAGFLASTLSSLSSAFNSITAMLFESFVQPLKPNMNANQANIISRLLCVCMSILSIALIFIVKLFPNVRQAAISVSAMISGPVMVLILFGLIFPQANFKAAFLSFFSGMSIATWIVVSTLLVKHPLKTKPLSIEGCFVGNVTFPAEFITSFGTANNLTVTHISVSSWTHYFPLYSISFLWISPIGIIISSTVFVILSQLFEKEKSPSEHIVKVIPDVLKRFHLSLSKPWRKALLCDVYDSENKIDKVDENVEILL